MGKRSLLGEPPGSAGSLRQQAMGEELTDQVKGTDTRQRWMDALMMERWRRKRNARVGVQSTVFLNTTFKRNERGEGDSS